MVWLWFFFSEKVEKYSDNTERENILARKRAKICFQFLTDQ